jgi:hypothetical protein
MSQGFFESDDDYRDRMRQEAAERIIENSTGDAPRQGFFESNEDYRNRVVLEANERVVDDSTGSAPRQGWFEGDGDYRTRMFEEANSRIVEDATGSAPRQGFFEDDEAYRSRVFEEANKAAIERATGSAPRQGWFEGDGDYRRRVALEAREHKSSSSRQSDSQSWSSDEGGSFDSAGPSSGTSSGGLSLLPLVFVILAAIAGVYACNSYQAEQRAREQRERELMQRIAAVVQQATSNVAQLRFADADRSFMEALQLADGLDSSLKQRLLEERNRLYWKIEIPAGGSVGYRVDGAVYAGLRNPLDCLTGGNRQRCGSYSFIPNDQRAFFGSRDDIVMSVSSRPGVALRNGIRTADLVPNGKELCCSDSQESLIPIIVFTTRSRAPASVYAVSR